MSQKDSKIAWLSNELYYAFAEFRQLPSDNNYRLLNKQLKEYKEFFYQEMQINKNEATSLADHITNEPPKKLYKVIEQDKQGNCLRDVILNYATEEEAQVFAKDWNDKNKAKPDSIKSDTRCYVVDYFDYV